VVLKGSGTVIAAQDHTSVVNHSGNAQLACAGTGDVLAGLIGARLGHTADAFAAVCEAVHTHGRAADTWPQTGPALNAASLAASLR
jgi:NAD(P)H-hydrate repair Nnr-like enzyme with NAD(P)H-hydrate dehydratase domain